MIQRNCLGCSNQSPAEFKDLKHLLRGSEIDNLVDSQVPLCDFELESELLIDGSKQLVDIFYDIDNEKLDLVEKLKDIEYIGLSKDKEIILRFKNKEYDEFNATAVYNFTNDFLDIFNMGKYSKYCISNTYYDLLKENITKLIEYNSNEERQFRLIEHNNNWYLRGLTSTRYKNYDNHLAIYLTLIALHNYSVTNFTKFNIEKAYLTDSEIHVFFNQSHPIKIHNLVDIHFGVYVSNSEIKEGTFSLELRYTIINNEGKSFSGLSNRIFDIKHTTGIEKFIDKIALTNLNEFKDNVLQLILNISSRNLSENQIYSILKKFNSSKLLSKDTKDKIKLCYDNELVNNTYTIIEALDKLNEIETDVEEKVYLERINNDVLKELNKKRTNVHRV